MPIYPYPPPHEQLNVFFGKFFRKMRKADPSTYGDFLMRAEEEFKRTGYREENSAGVENILIVRLEAIGDMVLTSGFLREVRKNFPMARITFVVMPQIYPMAELCPYVNEVLTFDKNLVYGNFVEGLEKVAVFCRDNLWQKKFSIAFSPRWFFDSFLALLILWLSGARERIGYGSNSFGNWLDYSISQFSGLDNFLLTKNILTPRNVVGEVEKFFYLLTAVGLKVTETQMELFYGAEDLRKAKELLENLPTSCKKVVLGIGASAKSKKYPVEKYLIALKKLAKKNLVFVIVGGKNEIADAAFLEKNLPPEKVLNLVNKTSLRETEAVITQMDFYLGNDTGTLHIAAAAKIPVLAIYRSAVDRDNVLPVFSEFCLFPPWQTKAIVLRPAHPLGECAKLPPSYGICRHLNEPHCIAQIEPQEIVDAFEKLETF